MTTTMSFFNPAGSAKGKSIFFHLYRTGVKRFLGLGCLYTIFLQLTYTLPMFFNVKHARANWAEEPITTVKALLSAYSYGAVFMTSALVCLCAILFSTVAYSYMHNRRGADFYHSLPAPRETLLLANFSAVFTWLALPLLASGVLCLLFFPGLGVPVPLGAALPAYFIFHGPWLLLFFVLMSLTAFVAVNAATVIETAGYTCAFSVMGSFLYYIWALMCGTFFSTYIMPPNSMAPHFLSPVFAGAYSIMGIFRHNPDFSLTYQLPLGLWVLLGVGLLFAALGAYRRRNSEIGQQWGHQSSLSFGVKVFSSVLGAFVLGGVFSIFLGLDKVPNTLLSAALGAPLGYIVVEAITAKGFDTIKKALPKIGAATMAVFCCGVYFALGGFGYDERVPKAASVTSVEVKWLPDFYGFSRLSDESAQAVKPSMNRYNGAREHSFQSPELIEAIVTLHQEAVQPQQEPGIYARDLDLTYQLSPFGTMRRGINQVSLKSLLALWQTPGYWQAANPFFELEPEYVTSAEVFDFLLKSKGSLTADQTAQLITAIHQDLLEQTWEDTLDTGANREFGIVRFYLKDNSQIYQETGNLFHYTGAFFYLRPQCKNTMALMEQWGYTGWDFDVSSIEQVEIVPEAIGNQLSMPFPEQFDYDKSFFYGQNALQISDPALIEAILKASTHLHNNTQGGQNMVYLRSPGTFYHPNGEMTTVYISNTALIELCSAYDVRPAYVLTAQDCQALLQANGGEKFPMLPDWYWYDGSHSGSLQKMLDDAVTLGEYCEERLPRLLAEKSPAVREAMYRTPFLSNGGILLYQEPQIGEYTEFIYD